MRKAQFSVIFKNSYFPKPAILVLKHQTGKIRLTYLFQPQMNGLYQTSYRETGI